MSNFIVLFVCTGNICRSPMAEGIMKDIILDKVEQSKLFMPVEALSAGVYAVPGASASPTAIKVSAQNGINLKFHRSRQITEQIAQYADLILTMGIHQTDYIKHHWPDIQTVHELKQFGMDSNEQIDSYEIVDPIGMDYAVYVSVFDELKKEITRVAPIIFSLAIDKIHGKK